MNEKNRARKLPARPDSLELGHDVNRSAMKTDSLRHKYRMRSECKGVRSVNVAGDRYLIISEERRDGRIRVLDLDNLEYLPNKYSGHTDSTRLVAITPDQKKFWTASWDGSYIKYSIATGDILGSLSLTGRSPSVYLDATGGLLFTASYDLDINPNKNNCGRCWDLSTGKVLYEYNHGKRKSVEAMDIAVDQDLEFAYTGSDDGTGKKWELTGEPVLQYFEFHGTVRKIFVSERYYAAACDDGYIRCHHKRSGERYRYLMHGKGKLDVREVRISKNEETLWSAAEDGTVSCFSLVSGELLYHTRVNHDWIWSLGFYRNETFLLTGSTDGSIAILESLTGKVVARILNLPGEKDFIIYSPSDSSVGNPFPNGFFYTTNRDLIQVVSFSEDRSVKRILDLHDQSRNAYIDKLNLKYLIKTRLKGNGHYTSLTEKYIQNRNNLNRINSKVLPLSLKAGSDIDPE